MKIRWIGLGVSALLAVVAVAVGFGVGMSVRGGAYSSLGALPALGSVTMIGHVLFYVAFGMLSESKNRGAAFLRSVLMLAGAAIVVVAGGLAAIGYSGGDADILAAGPWLAPFSVFYGLRRRLRTFSSL